MADSRRRSFPLRGPLLFGSQCLLRLSATSALPELQPRPGSLPFREPMPPATVCHLSAAGTPTASWFSASRLSMPPAAVCHLSAAGTPTASWSSAQSGCQCLLRLSATSALPVLQPRPGPVPSRVANVALRLSATSAPPVLQPRPGTGTMPTSTPEASRRGEGDIYRPFGTGTLNRSTSGAGSRGKTVWNRCQTGLLPMLRPDFGTTSPARGLSVASRRGEVDIYRPFGTGTLNRATSGAGSRGKTVWNRCQTVLLPMLRPDFGTASPARGLSVASRRGEGDIYRPFGTGTLNRSTSGAGSRGKTVWNRCQTGLLPMLRTDFGTAPPARGLSVASRRGEVDIYRPFGTGTLNRATSGAGSRGKTVWNRCQTVLLPMLRPDFGTASPARGLSVASWRGEVVIYRLFVHKMPLFHGR